MLGFEMVTLFPTFFSNFSKPCYPTRFHYSTQLYKILLQKSGQTACQGKLPSTFLESTMTPLVLTGV